MTPSQQAKTEPLGNEPDYDHVVIGGGAAGLMCAAILGRSGARVLVAEKANKFGKKILMSGGGHCNFTNYDVNAEHFISENPHFCKSALQRYTCWDFIALIESYNLAYHEKKQGQLFCIDKAKALLDVLLAECDQPNVELRKQCEISTIRRLSSKLFSLRTCKEQLTCKNLIVATGGLSIPSLGASDFGHRLAVQFGHQLTARDPALVALAAAPSLLKSCSELAGVALPVVISCGTQSFTNDLLFTHKGMSGPAVLQISNYWWPGQTLTIDFLPNQTLAEVLVSQGKSVSLQRILCQLLPKRFVQTWLAAQTRLDTHATLLEISVQNLSKQQLNALEEHLKHFKFQPTDTLGYKTAEVTRGGVSTAQVCSKTFESKIQPGLYFIGEVLDITGWLGGYNFQWAWASAWCAAQALGRVDI